MAKRKTDSAAAPSFAKYKVVYAWGQNLRSGPGMDFPVVRVLMPGEEVQATGRVKQGWLPVDGGWLAAEHLREV